MDFTSPGTVQRPKALPSVIMKLLLLAACLALGDGQEMEHGNIVEELTKAGLRKFFSWRWWWTWRLTRRSTGRWREDVTTSC